MPEISAPVPPPLTATTDGTDLAVVPTRRPLLTAVLLALVPVLFTIMGFVVGGMAKADDRTSFALAAMTTGAAAVIGVMVMSRSHASLRQYGFRAPRQVSAALWFVPMLVVVVLVYVGSGYAPQQGMVFSLVAMAVAAGFSEEIWFRGMVLSALRQRGHRYAVIVSSLIFGILHLVNGLNAKTTALYLVLQLLFAILFGVVASLTVTVTRSLWPAIIFHVAWDITSYLGGDALTGRVLALLAVEVVVLAGYAVFMWRRTPGAER